MRRILAISVCAAALAGCKTVPVLDANGNPTGEMQTVFAPENVAPVAGAMAPLLGPAAPFVLAAAPLLTLILNKKEGK